MTAAPYPFFSPGRWPWWVWILASLLLLVIMAISALTILHLQGQAKLNNVLANLRSKHLIYQPAEFVALAPTVDEDRQERAWAQQQRILKVPWAVAKFTNGLQRFSLKPQPRADQQLADDSLTERTAWRALYHEGPVVVSSLGWIRRDFPHPETIGIEKACQLRVANLLATRALANSISSAALLAKDPRTDLADLDALVHAMEPSGTLIDAMILCAISNIRDQAWLEATLRGTDPTTWIAQRPAIAIAVARAFSGERAWDVGALHQDYLQGRTFGAALAPGILSSGASGLWRCVAPHDLAFSFYCEGEIEQRLRGTPIDLPKLMDELGKGSLLHPVSNILIPNLIESGIIAIQADVTARRLRCAAVLVQTWRQTKQLPATTPDLLALLPTDLLAARGDEPAILYSLVAPGRFRLWTDPATPATDLLPAKRIDAPAPSTAAWSEGRWWLELDLNLIP